MPALPLWPSRPNGTWPRNWRLAIQQPLVHAVFDGTYAVYGYRYFENGELREEALPEGEDAPELDEATLLERLQEHGIATDLVDDR